MGMEDSGKTSSSVTSRTPRVSIGLPVYNGDPFIREALDSALGQTFEDFELIISDNASTDGTEQICRAYAAQDERIRYFRNDTNIGAAKNFNCVFELARGEYFDWLAADDAIEPRFLERCVSLLDGDPGVVLASTNYIVIFDLEQNSRFVKCDYDLRSPRARDRFRKYHSQAAVDRVGIFPMFGVIRSDVLRKTRMLRPFVGADYCLGVELVLKGKFAQVPEHLYRLRSHPNAFHRIQRRSIEGMQGEAETRWFDPQSNSRFLAFHWRRLWEYAKLIVASDETLVGKATMLVYLAYPIAYCWKIILIKELFFSVGAEYLYIFLRDKARRIMPRSDLSP